MRQGSPPSLIPRVLASLIGLISLFSLILVTALVKFDRGNLEAALEKQAAATADQLVATLGFPIWNVVTREIDNQLDWVMLDPDVQGVSLEIKDLEPPLRSRGRDRNWQPIAARPGMEDNLVVVDRSILMEGRPIANLKLAYTRRFVEERIRREAFLFAAFVLVEDLTLALGLLLLLRWVIFRPLKAIERFAAGISQGEGLPMPGPEGARGEIASLHTSVGLMVALLDERYSAIQAKEREYHSLFESGPGPILELDCSAACQALKEEGLSSLSPESLRERLKSDPATTLGLARKIHIRSANPAAKELFGSAWPKGILEGFTSSEKGNSLHLFADELVALATSSRGAMGECGFRLGPDLDRSLIVEYATLAGHEDNWSRVILSLTDISLRAKAEEGLRKALADKETLIQELLHRTGNSLQVVAGLLVLHDASHAGGGSKDSVGGLGLSIRAMALAYDQLYKVGDLSSVNLGDYLRDLLPLVTEGGSGRVATRIEAEDVVVVIDIAVPLGIVIAQLATNALSHAFPEGRKGSISLSLGKEGAEGVYVVFQDDGCGPPPGFSPRAGSGLGLQLVQSLIGGQLQGRVDYDFSSGFACTLHFKKDAYNKRV